MILKRVFTLRRVSETLRVSRSHFEATALGPTNLSVEAGSVLCGSPGCVCSETSSPTQGPPTRNCCASQSQKHYCEGLRVEASYEDKRVSHLPMQAPKSNIVLLTVPARLGILGMGVATAQEVTHSPPLPHIVSHEWHIDFRSTCSEGERRVCYQVLFLIFSVNTWTFVCPGAECGHRLLFPFGGVERSRQHSMTIKLKLRARESDWIQGQVNKLE